MARAEKEYMVAELAGIFQSCNTFFVLNLNGLKSEESNELRALIRSSSEPAGRTRLVVAKNSFCRLALGKVGKKELINLIEGSVAIVLGNEKPERLAKSLVNFIRQHQGLRIRGALLEEEVLTPSQVEEMAYLPGKEELLARMVYGFAYPISVFVGTLRQTVAGLVNCLDAICKKGDETTNKHESTRIT